MTHGTSARFRRKVARWAGLAGLRASAVPDEDGWDAAFVADPDRPPTRGGASPGRLLDWESRYGFSLPRSLRAWLVCSDGLYKDGPLVHPLTAIGPMIPFARVPDLVIQPESWFELGNPGRETVCIDLGYRRPGGDFPVFASGDDEAGTAPRVIASGFAPWLLRLLREGGREYWLDPGFVPLGDPWAEHRLYAPKPPLSDRLKAYAPKVLPLMHPGADDRSIARMLGVTRNDVEAIFRHLQHAERP